MRGNKNNFNVGLYLKSLTLWFYDRIMCTRDQDGMANSVNPDQTIGSSLSGSKHCLPRPACLKTKDHYGIKVETKTILTISNQKKKIQCSWQRKFLTITSVETTIIYILEAQSCSLQY